MTQKEKLENKRKRLIFRSWHRGTREMDLLMGSFADQYVAEFTQTQLAQYDQLLTNNDPDIYDWYLGRVPVPQDEDTQVLRKLMQHEPDKFLREQI